MIRRADGIYIYNMPCHICKTNLYHFPMQGNYIILNTKITCVECVKSKLDIPILGKFDEDEYIVPPNEHECQQCKQTADYYVYDGRALCSNCAGSFITGYTIKNKEEK